MARSRREPRRPPSHAKTTRTQTTPTPDREVIIPTYKNVRSSRSTGTSRWTCSEPGCNSTLNSRGASDILRHMETHLPPDQRRNSCTHCEHKFTQSSGLTRHMNSIHRKIKEVCSIDGCEYKCSDSSTLTHHRQREHGWRNRTELSEGKQKPMSQICHRRTKRRRRPLPDPLASFATEPSASTSSSSPHSPLLEAGSPPSTLYPTGPTPFSTQLPSLHQFRVLAGSPASVCSTPPLPRLTKSSSPGGTHLASTQVLCPVGLFTFVSPERQFPLPYYSTSGPSSSVSSCSTHLPPVQPWHQFSRFSSPSLSPVSPYASEASALPRPAVPHAVAPSLCLSADPPSPLIAREPEVQCQLVCDDPKWRKRMMEANWSKPLHDGGGD